MKLVTYSNVCLRCDCCPFSPGCSLPMESGSRACWRDERKRAFQQTARQRALPLCSGQMVPCRAFGSSRSIAGRSRKGRSGRNIKRMRRDVRRRQRRARFKGGITRRKINKTTYHTECKNVHRANNRTRKFRMEIRNTIRRERHKKKNNNAWKRKNQTMEHDTTLQRTKTQEHA